MSIWEVKTRFGGRREVVKQVSAKNLKIGSFPDNEVRLPKGYPKHLLGVSSDEKKGVQSFQQDVKAKVKIADGKLTCEWGEFFLEVHEVSKGKKNASERLYSWIGNHEIKTEDNEVVLWHMYGGQIVESVTVPNSADTMKMPMSGFVFRLDRLSRKLILHMPGGDLRTVELTVKDKTLSGTWDSHNFIVSSKADAGLAESLVSKKRFMKTIKRETFAPTLMLVLGVWLCLVAFIQFGPSVGEMNETVEEKLSPEHAKIRIERKQKQAAESKGSQGGGGVQTAKSNAQNGGSGYYDEVLVQDRNVLASAVGVLSAFSNLDKKMAGAVNAVGAGVIGGKNRARGILAALGNMAGSGGGGTGVGGVGTKGFGGGGGGGTGSGLGTGIGAGVGKGGGSGVVFEDANVSIKGALEKSEINAVIDENFAQIRFCYNRGLRGNPSLKGKVVSNFVIGSNGAVTVSKIASTTLLNSAVENCIKKRIATWNFPKPRGGGNVTVNYPFLFNRT